MCGQEFGELCAVQAWVVPPKGEKLGYLQTSSYQPLPKVHRACMYREQGVDLTSYTPCGVPSGHWQLKKALRQKLTGSNRGAPAMDSRDKAKGMGLGT